MQTLTETQQIIIDDIANGASMVEAINSVKGVDRPTLCNWRRTDPVFNEALEQAIHDRDDLNRERLLALSWAATTVLREIMFDDKASPSLRARAAQTILKHADTLRKAEAATKIQAAKFEKVHNHAQSPIRLASEPGTNTLCPCGSGQKFKRCCANQTPLTDRTADPLAA